MGGAPETSAYRALTACRICGSSDLATVLSLGSMPLANAFVRPDDRDVEEPRFPLAVLHCGSCGLLQLSVVVRPDILFRHYLYASSASHPMVEHFDALAEDLRDLTGPGSLVVEIGSNDGILLRPLKARGIRAVGVEPAANLAESANAAGLETWNDYFSETLARRLVEEKGRARAVVACNVLAHIDDLRGLVRALDVLLDREGLLVAEVPYALDLMDNVEYDTIYHEHLSYFGVEPLSVLFAAEGFEVIDVRRVPVHGGSIRAYARRRDGPPQAAPSVSLFIANERARRTGEHDAYTGFAASVEASRNALRDLLADLKPSGRLAGYGATAKGNTLLNFCGIGTETLDFVADTTPQKWGLLTPGSHIPVRPDDALASERPDYTLLLAWNYADAITRRHADYLARGGRFIHPIPSARLL